MLNKEFYSIKEFAEITGMSTRAIQEWIRLGKLKTKQAVTRGKHLIHESEVTRFRKEGQNGKTRGQSQESSA